MTGTIVQVSVSQGGIPKREIPFGVVTLDGIQGDGWARRQYHGGADQKVLLMAEESIERLKAQNIPVFAGALGENLTTRGINPSLWRAGQVWRAGTSRIELTKVRAPCSTITIYHPEIHRFIFDKRVACRDVSSPLWGCSGFYARVIAEGAVRPGDRLELESELA